MIEFLVGVAVGAAVGYGGAWAQHNPEKWKDLIAKIKTKLMKKAP